MTLLERIRNKEFYVEMIVDNTPRHNICSCGNECWMYHKFCVECGSPLPYVDKKEWEDRKRVWEKDTANAWDRLDIEMSKEFNLAVHNVQYMFEMTRSSNDFLRDLLHDETENREDLPVMIETQLECYQKIELLVKIIRTPDQ